MSALREAFAAHFGEDVAEAIEAASMTHQMSPRGDVQGPHIDDNYGSEPFRYHLLMCIGWHCLTMFRESHGIRASEADLRDWIVANAELEKHDGDVPDYLSLQTGAYTEWFSIPAQLRLASGLGEVEKP